jgi:capsular polysaccharide biosynthesis protein
MEWATFMNNDRLTQRTPRTIEDCYDQALAVQKDIERLYQLQLAELAVIKTALRELEKGIGRPEIEVAKTPSSDTRETDFVESCFDPAMPAPEILPTLLHVEKPRVHDPMKEERESPIGKLYTRILKQSTIIRVLWDFFGRKIYLFLKKYSHISLAEWQTRIQGRPLVKLSMRADQSPDGVYCYAAAETVEAPHPGVFPEKDREYLLSPLGRYVFPEVFLTTVRDAVVMGGTNLILNREEVLCHDLYDFVRDSTSEELHSRAAINPTKMRVHWMANPVESEVLPVAATFVDACAHNYAHWITEVLPRICLFCSDERFRDMPIIVNEGLHRNLMKSLFIVAGSERMIFLLPVGRAVRIERLLAVSPTGYVPFGRRTNELDGHLQGQFSPFAVNFLKTKIINHLNFDNTPGPKKIVIRRNSGTRVLLNRNAIEKLLVDRGFVVVEPEKLSFSEQVRIFSQAETIVGATGAAFANIVFCRPSSKLVIMIAKHESMPYWYWQNMAHSVGCQVNYVLGNIVRKSELGIHGDFLVDPRDVLNAITR